MKILILLCLLVSQSAIAQKHDHNHSSLQSNPPPTGSSILQLGSTWKNQRNESVKIADLQGRSQLVVMIFTRCETACPLLIEDLKAIATDLDSKTKKPVEVSIFSLDSYRETPKSLLDFASRRKIPAHWRLFTSNAGSVAELAAALGVQYKRLQSGDFMHSNVIFFLSEKGEIVAQKEGLKTPRDEFIKKIRSKL